MNLTKNAFLAASFAICAMAAAACSPKPSSVEVDPGNVTVNAAAEAPTLTARVLDDKGKDIKDAKVTWTSSDEQIVKVDATGKLEVVASGDAVVTAAAGSVKKEVPVKVALYSAVKAGEPAVTVKVGESKAATAQVLNEKNAPVEGAAIEWKSGDEAIATVSPAGQITGVAPGKTTVTATVKGVSAPVEVTVEALGPAELKADKAAVEVKAGASDKVTLTANDASGNPMADVAVTWTSSDEQIATVAPDGQITGVAPGQATITAQAGDKSVAVTVTVKK